MISYVFHFLQTAIGIAAVKQNYFIYFQQFNLMRLEFYLLHDLLADTIYPGTKF